ncbi:hypothetical protein Ddye_022243 [Dipteronia dyeriana]|uniref:N-acetyltransferase domain-containing protein n=1 Tax=Dipteronia dyeriana TaxID=168575 RepID=A0AAD9U3W8_9ROSI|nr:hypothetical protein Ddye_022243 [Dipteronia dyeriana]
MEEGSFTDISLRPLDLLDIDAFMEWAIDDKVAHFCTWEPYTSKEYGINFIKNIVLPHQWFRAICIDNRPVGYILVTPNSGSGDRCRGELGYVLAFKYWGKGIGTQAVKMVAETIFDELPHLERLEALVLNFSVLLRWTPGLFLSRPLSSLILFLNRPLSSLILFLNSFIVHLRRSSPPLVVIFVTRQSSQLLISAAHLYDSIVQQPIFASLLFLNSSAAHLRQSPVISAARGLLRQSSQPSLCSLTKLQPIADLLLG